MTTVTLTNVPTFLHRSTASESSGESAPSSTSQNASVSFSGDDASEEIVDLKHLEQDTQDEGEDAELEAEDEPTEAVVDAPTTIISERSWSEESTSAQTIAKREKRKVSGRLTRIRTTQDLRESRGGPNARVTRGLSRIIRSEVVEPQRWIMCLLCPMGK